MIRMASMNPAMACRHGRSLGGARADAKRAGLGSTGVHA